MTVEEVLANLQALDLRIAEQCQAMTELRGVLDELNAERTRLIRAAIALLHTTYQPVRVSSGW